MTPITLSRSASAPGGRTDCATTAANHRPPPSALHRIVYTTFCQTFYVGTEAGAGDFIATLVLVVALYAFYCACIHAASGLACLDFSRRDRVSVLFCATHKTVAAGIPMLNTIFEGHPDLGLFVLPLLVWHPLQLFVGSAAVPWLSKWIDAEERSVQERREAEGDDTAPADTKGAVPAQASVEAPESSAVVPASGSEASAAV